MSNTEDDKNMYSNPFLAVINHQPACRPPVWMMRQAGRVLPRYRNLTQTHPFRSIMAHAPLAAEVTLMPIDDMGMDAAILFSDILVIPEALGVKVEWTNEGPAFPNPLLTVAHPAAGLRFDPTHLTHVADTLDEIARQKTGDTPVIGFCGGPLTCLCYMLGGRDKTLQFAEVVRYLYSHREEALQLLEALTSASEHYVHLQAAHGIAAFQIFESFAGVISAELYAEMVLPFVRRITAAARQHGLPVIFFPKGFGAGIQMLSKQDCDFVSIDWQTPLTTARELVDPALGLQGNLDPRVLFAPQPVIEQQLEKYLQFFREHPNWIFNLGHGLHKDTPLENVQFVTAWFKQRSNC